MSFAMEVVWYIVHNFAMVYFYPAESLPPFMTPNRFSDDRHGVIVVFPMIESGLEVNADTMLMIGKQNIVTIIFNNFLLFSAWTSNNIQCRPYV